MNKFSGIDLHSNNSVVVVSDDADRVVYQRRLPNDPVQIRAALAPHREDLVGVVIEATYNWYWLVDQLMNDGYRVHLANPAAIRQYEGLKYSGDFTDAAHLAQLLRLGLLPEGYIYPAEERPVRDLSRKRIQLVQCRTAQILAIENLFSRHTGGQMQGERVKRLDEMQSRRCERERIGLIVACRAVEAATGYALRSFHCAIHPHTKEDKHSANPYTYPQPVLLRTGLHPGSKLGRRGGSKFIRRGQVKDCCTTTGHVGPLARTLMKDARKDLIRWAG
ncbi:transposase [Paraburkholderia sp. BL9I2N2]|uniref:IS110 family transposase n=1 Tax=Paraburkholderia sp. BL9I2N2 TaxID=1938809 RepID=UPI0010D43B8B|nr:transposase [Paraburkholderia sp. BL9I2N2]TCK94518.1 transposase [Paraburkholderia sp. BL9I2N2]